MNNRLGEERLMNCGMKAKIIRYGNCEDMDIKFENGYIVKNRTYDAFKKGSIKNLYCPSVYNVGYLGETKIVDENGKGLKSYDCWHSMLQRCYDENFHFKYPTYKGCVVCEEWKCYKNFKEWHDNNYYKLNNQKMHLDKDILIKGNKIYSPKTCIFVPQTINSLFIKNNSVRGELPIGVSRNKKTKKYASNITIESTCSVFLGYFDTPEEAFYSYKEAKEKEIKRVADEYKDRIPQKLYEAMYNYTVDIDD